MALTTRSFENIKHISRHILRLSQQKSNFRNGNFSKILYRSFANTPQTVSTGVKQRDPAPLFFDEEVQSRLLEMNLKDTSKVFEPRKEGQDLSDPDVRFLTEEELEEEQSKALETAKQFLQVPPILLPSEEQTVVLSEDPELQGLEESKMLFIDISFGRAHRDRLIVAREPNGTLRHASREERHRMIQAYFPQEGRSYEVPAMFSSENLKSLLDRSEFAFILDRACIQFEPDDPQYVQITSSTYDFIDQSGKYDDLIGTRHYGALAFYLIFHGKFDKFLKHCISTCKIEDAVNIVRIFYITRPDLKVHSTPASTDDTNYLKEYIQNYSTEIEKPLLSRTLNAYLELNLPTAEKQMSM